MKIYPDSFYCFGCGAHGDIFAFVQKMEGISFKDAFKSLGGTYPEHEKSEKKQTFLDVRHRIRDQKAAALKRQKDADMELAKKRSELRDVSFWCGIYAKGMRFLEPMSDEWCFCANRIDAAFYKHETLLGEIWREVRRRGG
jgi:DNA primase